MKQQVTHEFTAGGNLYLKDLKKYLRMPKVNKIYVRRYNGKVEVNKKALVECMYVLQTEKYSSNFLFMSCHSFQTTGN